MVQGIGSQIGLGLLQQSLQSQQVAASQMIQGQQQMAQKIAQDGDGDHGIEPHKGQQINALA